jgi:hypothetical protein
MSDLPLPLGSYKLLFPCPQMSLLGAFTLDVLPIMFNKPKLFFTNTTLGRAISLMLMRDSRMGVA